jgi:hypothetical protein
MNINQIKQSNFLKKEDVGGGVLVTIKGDVFQENVAMEGAPPELKYCLHFDGLEKPMVLNSINAQLIAQITGSEETSTWNGHKVVLYTDPSVSFGGKLVGGIRVRAPRGIAAAKPAPAPVNQAATGINNPALRAAAAAPRPAPLPEPELPPQEEDDQVPF